VVPSCQNGFDTFVQDVRPWICYGSSVDIERHIPGTLVMPYQLSLIVKNFVQRSVANPREVIRSDEYEYVSELFSRASDMRSINQQYLNYYKSTLDVIFVNQVIVQLLQELLDVNEESGFKDLQNYFKGCQMIQQAMKQDGISSFAKKLLYDQLCFFTLKFKQELELGGFFDVECERRLMHAQYILNSKKRTN